MLRPEDRAVQLPRELRVCQRHRKSLPVPGMRDLQASRMTVPNVLLSGIVGSVAYGLATPDSDEDRLGFFAYPTEKLLGIHPSQDSIVQTAPDVTFHEAGKFLALALKCNPTITELLWLPEDLYETRTELGNGLIAIRASLLSAPLVRNAYLGYATQQFRRLENRSEKGDHSFSSDTKKRTAKHARHLLRLLIQGTDLYLDGEFSVRLKRPEMYRAFGEKVAAGDTELAKLEIGGAERWMDGSESALPEKPDYAKAQEWLLRVRREFW